jgi:PKD repeat protein
MMRNNKFSIVSTGVLLLLMLAVPSLIQAGPPVKKDAARIRLGKIEFAPARGEKPKIPQGLAIRGYQKGQPGYYIIQFPGPIREAWKKQATEAGAEILDYIPDFAFKVRMTPEKALEVKELESVTWVGLYQPAYKLSPDLKRNGTHMYTVRIERSADVEAAKAAIAKSGAKVVRHKGNILKVTADSTQLEAIARVLDVAWIQNFMMWEKHNEWGGGVILGGSTANANGYDGSDQIIGIADTGLGGGTDDTAHLHLPQSRIKAIRVWTRAHFPQCIDFFCYCVEEILANGAEDRDSGHGTHTTLSALGDGGPSNEGRGVAPGAQLIFQAVEDYVHYYPGPGYEGSIDTEFCEWLYDVKSGYYLSGIPSNIAELFQQAYNEGARIHSNSWGSNAMGAYTADSRNADKFIWDLLDKDMTITYSAGNRGIDANADGVIDSDSIGSPATAKNVITVGASENERDNYPCDDSLEMGRCDGYNEPLFTYGQAWPGDFPANPINGDPVAGEKEQMAAFSSRGPTNDGRIKPDLVAPGTFVLSGYSDLYQEGYDPSRNPQNNAWQYDGWSEPYSRYYKYMGGTSMSSPLVAGAAAVVRDFYQKTDDHSAAAALVKATLINSAYDLLDENNDGADDNAFPIPNVHEGWGRVDLANATDGSHLYVDDSVGLHTGGMSTYNYNVVSNGSFKVTLVWSDYPSATGVSKNLVNDLDLKVTSPQDTIYFGNVFSGGWSVTGGTEDRLNNVENVYVQSPEEGTWTVEVKAFNVPYGPQPFALVVDGADFNRPPTASFTADPLSGEAPLTVAFNATNSSDPDGDDLTYTWNFGDGSDIDTESGVTANHIYTEIGTHTAVLTVADTYGAEHTASKDITVTAPLDTLHVENLSVKTRGGRLLWRMRVTATVKDANGGPVVSARVWYSWSDSPGSIYGDCLTDQSGVCSVAGYQFRGTCLTFTVEDVSHNTLTYDPGQNKVNDISACK